jgi:oligoribonuclease NrnB/cAMP/cGMP phosphodiesterase (DHH superfamily)
MKKIPKDAKILAVSHDDLDGVGCQILLGGVFKNIEYRNCSYFNIDKELMAIDSKDYDYVFVTDISPKIHEVLDDFDNLILIDHHQNAKNDPTKHRYVNKKYSATYLTNHFLKKMYGEDKLKRFSKIVTLINDYDMWILKYKGSKALNDLFSLYNSKKFRQRFRSGKLSLTKHEKDHLQGVQDSFDKLYDEIVIEEFEKINACWFEADIFVNEIAHKLMMEEGYDCVMFNTLKSYKVSIRSKMDDFNFGLYLKENDLGGGHKKAAGINVNTQEEMNNIVDFLEKDLYEKIPSIRK